MKNPNLKPMPTHEQRVENYLKKHKRGLTSIEAFKKWNYTRLSAHVFNLKEKGLNIISEDVIKDGKYFVRYKLVA